MSHFTVLVTNTHENSVDTQLERFYEQGEEGDYFMEWYDQTEEFREQYDNESVKEYWPSRGTMPDKELQKLEKLKVGSTALISVENKLFDTGYKQDGKYYASGKDYKPKSEVYFEVESLVSGENHGTVHEGQVMVRITDGPKELPMKDKYPDYNLYLKDYHGIEDTEKQGYWHNPDAQWDWYTIGGRWSGYFIKKDGAKGKIGRPGVMMEPVTDPTLADVIKVKDIDWDAMESRERENRGKLWDEWHNAEEGKKPFLWNGSEVESMTRDEYINRPISHATFAVLHEDQWYEKGDMGWFGMVSNEKEQGDWDEEFRKLIEQLGPEAEVSIVDCHI